MLGEGDSQYIPNVFDKEILDDLEREVKYFPREIIKYKMYGNIVTFKRDVCFYGKTFKYKLINPPDHLEWTKVVADIRDKINEIFGQKCNSSIVNRYYDGDYIGPHKDATINLKNGSSIFSVSFGASRTFKFTGPNNQINEVTVESGSVIVLGPKTNKYWKHSIVSGKGLRISVTLRTVV